MDEKDDKEFAIMMVAEFDRMFFQNEIQQGDLLQFETYLEQIDYLVKVGQEENIIPASLGAPFFIRLLEMCRQLFECTYQYVPTPLHLSNGNITYCSTRPNADRVTPFYPRFDTWEEYIPQASTHKFNDFDHYSLLRDGSGVKQLAEVIQQRVERISKSRARKVSSLPNDSKTPMHLIMEVSMEV